jgi:formate dehydrogenase iron-sulfur subunit
MNLRLFVPGDAGAVALGADEVASALQAAAVRRNAQTKIVRTGSHGLYWLERMVEVATEAGWRVAYGPVAAADAESVHRTNRTE